MSAKKIWLRCEKKEFERRTAITPTTAKTLVDAGFELFVERDNQRIFRDEDYEGVGCQLVENNSWPNAPADVPIVGLKEFPESDDFPLSHAHIQFAHAYKQQAGWSKVLTRFHKGGGTLYDLEFLTDEQGRRVAAFGYHAGFAGAAVGALVFAAEKTGSGLSQLTPYDDETAMVEAVKRALGGSGKGLRVIVIGALGRCGRGAVDLFRKAGVEDADILKWDMAETARGGPFQEILDADIFVNCIYLSSPVPPFITNEQIEAAGQSRRLRVAVDVSCDTTNPHNPLPVYSINTTFAKPTVPIEVGEGNPPLSMVSIDQLPSLLPKDASEQFSANLLPSLLQLPSRRTARVWVEAENLFRAKLTEAIEVEGLLK